MKLRSALLGVCALGLACAGQQTTRTSDALFGSPAAELASEYAPDLYDQAQTAWTDAEEAQRRKDERAADDLRTEARLWLDAAVAEAERVQLDRRRAELQREEERWAKQLARDQQASAVVAQDISRYEARAVALQEAERLSTLSEGPSLSDATLDAILTRVRLNLALAEALGATDAQLLPLRDRADAIVRTPPPVRQGCRNTVAANRRADRGDARPVARASTRGLDRARRNCVGPRDSPPIVWATGC